MTVEDEVLKEIKDKIANVEISSVDTQGGTVLIHLDTVGHMEPALTTVLIAVITYLDTKIMQPLVTRWVEAQRTVNPVQNDMMRRIMKIMNG